MLVELPVVNLLEQANQSQRVADKRSIIGGKVPPRMLPPSTVQLEELWDRYQALAVSSEQLQERSARINAAFRRLADKNPSYANYGDLSPLRIVPEAHLKSIGPFHDAHTMHSKGQCYAAFFTDRDGVITEPFARAATDEELLQLLVHGQTLRVGRESVTRLNMTGRELKAVLGELKELNEQKPGWGITPHQEAGVTRAVATRTAGTTPLEDLDSAALAGLNLDELFTDLDIAPQLCQRVKGNAIEKLAALREQDFADPSSNGFPQHDSALDRKVKLLADKEGSVRPMRVTFVSFGSPWHYALWNNLSIDTLAGDLIGEFGKHVRIDLKRAISDETVDAVIAELKQSPPDIVGLSIELGTLQLIDRFAEGFEQLPAENRPLLVVGNQVPTYFPERFVNHPKFPQVFACLHEGELAMRGLVEHVLGYRELSSIPNLVYRDAQTGRVVETELKKLNLSTLPHTPTADTAKPGITNMIQASRGCIFSCAYCTRHETYDAGAKLISTDSCETVDKSHNWRPFSLPRVFENVECFVAKGIFEIEFCDDEFFGGRSAPRLQRMNDFAEGMRRIARKYATKLTYRIFTTPLIVARANNDGKNQRQNQLVRATLENLIDSGMVRVYIGLESANAVQKKRYDRKETVDDTAAALRTLRGLGLDIDVGFIMFDPHLRVEEMLDNVEYFRNHDVVKYNTWPFRPLVVNEGTPIKKRLEAEGLLTGKQDPNFLAYEYRFKDPVVERIATAVQTIAKETGAIFYTLKTVSKAHWKGQETPEMTFAREAVERNAFIYLDLMEWLGRAAQKGTLATEEQACKDRTRAALLDLVNEVKQKKREGLFDVRAEDVESLDRHLATFDREFLATCEQASARVRRGGVEMQLCAT